MADAPDNQADRPARRQAAKQSSSPPASAGTRKAAAKPAAQKPPGRERPEADSKHPGGDHVESGGSRSRLGTAEIAIAAAEQLVALTGKPFEGVVGLRRNEQGWDVEVEVVETRRIPNTTDVIAVYLIAVDSHGDLLDYRRVHRYLRGQVGEE
jgi:Gas vesicle synthesis protein GvpO